jgi:hypothetical protein
MQPNDVLGTAAIVVGVLAGAMHANECEQRLDASADPMDAGVSVKVAVSGDTLVAGAFGDDDFGADSGSAYFFRSDDEGVWTETAHVTASDGAAGDLFGGAVAIAGGTAVVGACGDDDNGIDSGSAYVFRSIEGTWMQVAKLTPADGAAEDRFGCAVAVSGDTIVIGARGDDDHGTDSGSAYVFRENSAGDWEEIFKLTDADGADGDWFGRAVGISGETIIIGAPRDGYPPCGECGPYGSAHIFHEEGEASWSLSRRVSAVWATAFGSRVAIDGDTAVVCAAVVRRDGAGQWSAAEPLALTVSGGLTGVAVCGDRIAVRLGGWGGGSDPGKGNPGTPFGNPGGCPWQVRTQVYEDDGNGDWTLVTSVTPSGRSGPSVALSEAFVLVGAVMPPFGDDGPQPNADVAYAFEIDCDTPCYPDFDGDGFVNAPDLLRLLDAWGCQSEEDLDDDGGVDVDDLIMLITAWGAC